MPDNVDDKSQRSAADKERSRQESRSVTGRNAGRSVSTQQGRRSKSGSRPARGGGDASRASGRSASGVAGKGGAQKPKGGQAPRRPARGAQRTSAPRRSSTALLTWGIVALVLVIVVVLVVVKLTGSSTTTATAPKPQTVPGSVLQQVTHVPLSVYNTVGVTSPTAPVSAPTVKKGEPPLTFHGKPGYLFVGGEFCPFCAAERWGVVTGLSRFGTFTGLETMQSAASDQFPNTETFTFAHATYTSPYLGTKLIEHYSNVQNSAGTAWQILQPITSKAQQVIKKYDKTTSSTSSGSIPFADIGNKVIMAGASFSPSILEGLSRAQIATGLTDAKNPVTQAIISTANYLSAGVCAADGAQPAKVCTSKGVTEAATALGLGS